MDHICWYADENAVLDYHKTCIPAYASSTAGGWLDDVMQHMPYLKARVNGKMCTTMIASKAIAGEYTASCSTIGFEKESRYCKPFSGKSPFYEVSTCSIPGGTVECQCGLSGFNDGACAVPPQELLNRYAETMRALFTQMDYCHTMDRENLIAFGECGYKGVDNEAWQLAVLLKLQMETIAQFDASECIKTLHPWSET